MKKVYLGKAKLGLIKNIIFQNASKKVIVEFFNSCVKRINIKRTNQSKIQTAQK